MPLDSWWDLSYASFVETFSGIDPTDPGRIFRGVLARNADIIVRTPALEDEGQLFFPICATLGSTCYLLSLALTSVDWASARADVVATPGQLTNVHSSMFLQVVEPAEAFRQDASQALTAAGVIPNVTVTTSEAARTAALHVAAPYLMRLLIAYGRRCDQATDPAIVAFRQLV